MDTPVTLTRKTILFYGSVWQYLAIDTHAEGRNIDSRVLEQQGGKEVGFMVYELSRNPGIGTG